MDGAIFNSQTRRSPVTFVILEMDNLRNFELRLLFEFSHKAKKRTESKVDNFPSNYNIYYDVSTFWRTLRYVKKLKIVMILQLLTDLTLRQIVEKS